MLDARAASDAPQSRDARATDAQTAHDPAPRQSQAGLWYDKCKPWLTAATKAAGVGAWQETIGMLIAFAASVFFASLLYRFVETPFLRLKRRFAVIPSRD